MRISRLLGLSALVMALVTLLVYPSLLDAQGTPPGSGFGGGRVRGGAFGGSFGGGGLGPDQNVVSEKQTRYYLGGETYQVKITFQPDVYLTTGMLQRLFLSPHIAHAAILDIGGKPNPKDKNGAPVLVIEGDVVELGPSWGGVGQFSEYKPIGDGVIFVEMGAFVTRTMADLEKLDEAAARAKYLPILKKYFAALRKRLETELTAITRRQFDSELERLRESASRELALAKEAQDRVAQIRDELRILETGVPREVLLESVSNLQKQRQQLELDLAGMKGREAALQVEVARTAERIKKEPGDGEIEQNLKRVLNLRLQQLKNLRTIHELGTVTENDVVKAEEQVALAQVNLAQAKKDGSRSAAEQMEKLNVDLAQLAVNKAETEAKLTYVKEQLERDSEFLRHETQRVQPAREKLAIDAAAAQTLLTETHRRQAELRRMDANFRPAFVEVFSVTEPLWRAEPKIEATKEGQPK